MSTAVSSPFEQAEMRVEGIGYVGFESPAVESWRVFGPEVLGLGVSDSGADADSVYLRMDDLHHRLAIHPGPVDKLAYIGWEVKGRSTFDQVVADLADAGVEVAMGTRAEVADRCVMGMAWLVDPSGLRHELFHGQGYRWRSFLPGRPHGGFITGDQGMGHMVVYSPEPDAWHAFATGVLGLEPLTYHSSPKHGAMGFYRGKGRHHAIGLLGHEGYLGCHHVHLQVADLDDLGIAWSEAQSRGHRIPIDLGRHQGDHMLSFYVETPSKFFIEYGWGGRDASASDQLDVESRHFGPPQTGSYWGHRTDTGLSQALTAPDNVRP